MAQVTIEINGYAYTIGCDDGEEERVAALGAFLDRRARGLAGQVGNPGEARLLAMTALLLADDLHNAHEEIDRLRQQIAEGGEEAEIPEDLLQRLETVAERMENP